VSILREHGVAHLDCLPDDLVSYADYNTLILLGFAATQSTNRPLLPGVGAFLYRLG
jgi:hypothetical protein